MNLMFPTQIPANPCTHHKKKTMGLAATWKSEYLNMVDSLNCQSYSTPLGHSRLQTPVHIMERTRDLKFSRHWPLTSSFVASSRLELNIRWREYIWGEFSHSNHWSSWISKNTSQPPKRGIVWVSRTEAKQDTLNLRRPRKVETLEIKTYNGNVLIFFSKTTINSFKIAVGHPSFIERI